MKEEEKARETERDQCEKKGVSRGRRHRDGEVMFGAPQPNQTGIFNPLCFDGGD